ncbi:MAG: ATP-binding cassette domain-containing protein [Candidatus Korarchaeum sp.]|nr:ATP-binding cassette domain-containing protein [Candidatus Korarchaeum sp.]
MDISELKITKGERVGLLGKSGSGKTTLLRILRGVEPFDGGRVVIDGIELTPESDKEKFREVKKRTAIHLQRSFGLWSEKTIDNVIRALSYTIWGDEILPEEGTSFYEELFERAMNILELVDLKHKAECWAEVLSGGEKQRLVLARQVAKNPSILLVDEFGTMTCPETRRKSIEVLKKINENLGITVIFSSHMPDIHEELAGRVIVLDKGVLVGDGSVEESLERFLSRTEASIIREDIKKGGENVKSDKVSKKYYVIPGGRTLELNDVTFSVRKGEIVGLVGRSGSGKTVISRLIAGLELPDKGKILIKTGKKWINWSSFGEENVRARRKIGILHQEFALPYWALVRDLISYRIRLKREDIVKEAEDKAKKLDINEKLFDVIYRMTDLPKEEAEIRLKRLGLSYDIVKELFTEGEEDIGVIYPILEELDLPVEILERYTHELSGGESVRLGIALAAVTKPDILILDEPFGDIDPLTLRKVINFLKKINIEQQTTMIIVSHQHDLIREIADRVFMIRGDHVEEYAPHALTEVSLGNIELHANSW